MNFFKKTLLIILSVLTALALTACEKDGGNNNGSELKSLISVEKTASEGLIDVYTFKFSDGTSYSFSVKNGEAGNKGDDGITPQIGGNGNWWIGTTDTGVKAEGKDGQNGNEGNKGDDGITPQIGENGNWWIGTTDTGVKAEGKDGQKGDTVTITKIEEINSVGLVDTYSILLSDGSNFTFEVRNGEDGKKGDTGAAITVTSIEKTGSEGLTDTYTVTYSDNSKFYFTVTNGKDALTEDKITISNVEFVNETVNTVTYKINYSDDSSSSFTLNTDGEDISSAVSAYNSAKTQGYKGSLNTWISELVMKTKEELLTSGSIIGAKTLGAAMPQILNSYDKYFKTSVNEVHIKDVELELIEGYYYFDNGGTAKASENADYRYNKPLAVESGQIIRIINRNTRAEYGHRFWVAFYQGAVVSSASGADTSSKQKIYTVPEGVDSISITWEIKWTDSIASVSENEFVISLSSSLDAYTVNTMINGSAGGSGVMKDTEAEIIISSVLGSPSVSATAEVLPAKEWIYLTDRNTVMNNKTLSFSADIEGTLSSEESIWIGHGYTEYASSYVILTGTRLTVFEYYNATKYLNRLDIDHGLTIKDFVSVTIDVGTLEDAKITVSTSTGMIQKESLWGGGRNGKVFLVSQTTELKNVTMRWVCEGYSQNIWIYGDSYLGFKDPSRWPYYLIKDGYVDHMMSSYPGMSTQVGLEQFKNDLYYGTPQYAIWCMGMNNGDDNKDTVNEIWLSCTEEFLKICSEKGITPILATIPSTPVIFNYAKSEWVKSSGYRYIDFAHAVGGDRYDASLIGKTYTKSDEISQTEPNETGAEWYETALYEDLVHPAVLGAQLLYARFLIDFPEITQIK